MKRISMLNGKQNFSIEPKRNSPFHLFSHGMMGREGGGCIIRIGLGEC